MTSKPSASRDDLADVTQLNLRAVSRHAVGLPELEKIGGGSQF